MFFNKFNDESDYCDNPKRSSSSTRQTRRLIRIYLISDKNGLQKVETIKGTNFVNLRDAGDGTKDGFAVGLTRKISESVKVPVIASGGAGRKEHFAEVFERGRADAALAASVFHFREIEIPDLKKYLKQRNIAVRI